MAITMVDIARGLKDQVVQGVLLNWARKSQLMQNIPFEDVNSFVIKTWQNKSVTDAVFRDVGESYSETIDDFTEKFEGVYLLGGQVDIDRALKLPGQKELDAHAENLNLQSERFMFGFTETFINGDRTSNPKGFDGLLKRTTDLDNDGDTDARIKNDSGLDISASSANRQKYLDQLHEAFFNVRDGDPSLIITGKRQFLSLRSAARREGLLDTTKDTFDRVIDQFAGVTMMFAGTKGDQSTEIVGNAETNNGGARTGGTASSLYIVKFGMPNLIGLQMGAPERTFDDITDDGVTHRTVFEWPVGLATFDNRSIVRVSGIKPF